MSDVAPPTAAALRAALIARCGDDSPPGAWRAAAAAAGVSGADAFLCHLSRSIAAALERLAASAEEARTRLEEARAKLEDRSHCDELEARIASAESSKRTALELELCAVDAVLERLRIERGAVAEAVASLDDAELATRHAELTVRLDATEAQLLALPTTVVELPHVELVLDEPALLAGVACFGRVIAPRAVTAADLTLIPDVALRGKPLRLRLLLHSTTHTTQSLEELAESLGAAAAEMHVVASLEAHGAAPLPLAVVDVSVIPHERCISMSCSIPPSAPACSSVCVGSVTVSGQLVAGVAGPLPLGIPVRRGLQTPLELAWSDRSEVIISLCIAPAGQLFVPQNGSPSVIMFDSDGAPLPGLPVEGFGLSSTTVWAALAGSTPTILIFADVADASPRLVAVDPVENTVCWTSAPGAIRGCSGLAVLPDPGIFFAASFDDRMLFAHRLSDGERVESLRVAGLGCYLTADPSTRNIFGAVASAAEGREEVARFSWTPGTGLVLEGVVVAAGERRAGRPLAVVPPAPGKRLSHLVVGSAATSELLVIVLPGLALVHTHVLGGMEVAALAADPWGEALAVSDWASESIHVLAWPLPGMPALE